MNVKKDFEPVYIIPHSKTKQVRKLKSLLKSAGELYLATDEDREGEAISWHLCEVLQPKVPVHRLVFHEITKEAIIESLDHPRDIDDNLVRAQETRRIIDRLYGYDVSPLLWRKIRPRLSAGRVQSVAVRLIVERERQRMAFKAATYWDLLGMFAKTNGESFQAELISADGRKIPESRDFDPATGLVEGPDFAAARRTRGRRIARAAPRRRGPDNQPGKQALYYPPLSALYHQHAAAGGQPQIRLYRPAHHANCPKPVRDRAYYLHANRLDQSGGGGRRDGPVAGGLAVRRRISARAAAHLSNQGKKRPGGARSHPPGRP